MSELSRKMEALRTQVQVEWTPERSRAAERSMTRRIQRRARARRIATVALVLAVLAGAVGMWRKSTPAQTQLANVLRLEDGSVASALTVSSEVRVVEVSPNQTVLSLVAGAARFEVTPNPRRVFKVQAGTVEVQVIGTAFTVSRLEGQVEVTVHHGRVRVISGPQTSELVGGETRVERP